MIVVKWIKGWFFLIRQYRKQKKIESDIYNAKKHALLALAYWNHCNETYDLHFQIEESPLYVRLGRSLDLYEAGQKKNSEN